MLCARPERCPYTPLRSHDTLVGGVGTDRLTGGADADIFTFNNIAESPPGAQNRDVILDFQQFIVNERIDLSAIDANTTLAGNQAFTFIGTNPIDSPGDLRFSFVGSDTVVQANVNNNLAADFQIELAGIHPLTANDFIA